jgi:hypothetical protein
MIRDMSEINGNLFPVCFIVVEERSNRVLMHQ